MKKRGELYIVGGLLFTTLLSGIILSSSTASAETYTKSALIRVQAACTLDGVVTTSHIDTIANGTYKSEIGETVLSAVCNDGGGFGIYAIGYTNDTDGNNVMKHDTDDTYNIATGTATSGNTSNWAMKLTAVEDGDNTPTILNGYNNYSAVPSDYTKVASYPNATAENSSVSFLTNYATYISLTQHSGVYTGKVKYVMVHPSNGPAPEKSGTFGKAFSDAGKTKVTVNNQQYYKIQDMTSIICSEVFEGQTIELVDIRDNTVYHVGKLLDGRGWLLDNLALDVVSPTVQANLSSDNTNATQTAIVNYINGGNPDNNVGWATEGVSYYTDSYNLYNQPRINSASKNVVPYDTLSRGGGWKVGIYYNYCAASVSTYCYAFGEGVDTNPTSIIDVDQDICPANWRMPAGGYDGEYQALYSAYQSIDGGDNRFTRFRKALRLSFSGYLNGNSTNSQGNSAYVWSSTFWSNKSMYYLGAGTSSSGYSDISWQIDNNRIGGFAVRCIAK